jgi:hypothetical protein
MKVVRNNFQSFLTPLTLATATARGHPVPPEHSALKEEPVLALEDPGKVA